MSAHPAPRATRAIRAETAGSSSPALGPNQRGKAGGEVEASIPVIARAHQRTRGKVPRRTWPNLAATPLDQGDAGATGRVSRFSLALKEVHPGRVQSWGLIPRSAAKSAHLRIRCGAGTGGSAQYSMVVLRVC